MICGDGLQGYRTETGAASDGHGIGRSSRSALRRDGRHLIYVRWSPPSGTGSADLEVLRPRRHAEGPSTSRSARSEEHTSELQSPDHLVCRLLLEKKNDHTLVVQAVEPL